MSEILSVAARPPFSNALLRACLAEFPHVRLRVTGACMAPHLQPGDSVLIASSAAPRPGLGDVVLVRPREGLRLHRLVWKPPFGRSVWRTKGDRSRVWDSRIQPADVLGTVLVNEEGRTLGGRREALA